MTRYDPTGPSSRYRFYQYFSHLKKENIDLSVFPLFNSKYVQSLYFDPRGIKFINPLNAYLKRTARLLFSGSYDLVWMEKEALPWIPALIEKLLYNRSVPYVIDYDDAVHHRYDQHHNPLIRSVLSKKIEKLMAFSTVVVAGNKYIANYAQNAGALRVEVLPTVVDINNFKSKENFYQPTFRIGWLGSPSTSRHLNIACQALKTFCEFKDTEFVAIGALQQDLDNIPGRLIVWNEKTEISELSRFDVGIMPLPDTPWERGKCGFKLIQYMATGLPVIASPVGVNSEIVEHGVNGFLASDRREWIKYLGILKEDRDMCRKMGAVGRVKIEKSYSLEIIGPRLISILREAAKA